MNRPQPPQRMNADTIRQLQQNTEETVRAAKGLEAMIETYGWKWMEGVLKSKIEAEGQALFSPTKSPEEAFLQNYLKGSVNTLRWLLNLVETTIAEGKDLSRSVEKTEAPKPNENQRPPATEKKQ